MASFKIPSIFEAVDKLTTPVEKMGRALGWFGDQGDTAAARIERRFRKIGESAAKIAGKAAVGAAIVAAPLIMAGKSAVEFEDKMADIAKTTGLEGKALEGFGDNILSMTGKTRTSIEELEQIGEIGGQLGIAQDELVAFTGSANKFNIALGSDFSGGVEDAVAQIGKIKSLFKETRNINIADSILKTGSAINELGAVGNGTSENIADFTLRLGALPDALKPSVTNTMALGAYLEEMGIDSQIAAGGLTNFLLVAGKNMPAFAKQMGIGEKAAKQLLSTDPTEFAKKFATSLNKLSADQLAKKLESLHVGSQETIKVIGSLGSGVGRLTELQKLANKAFTEGISLNNEAEKKESTRAAQLAKLKNGIEAISIKMGTALLPIITDLAEKLMPVIDRIFNWIKANPELTKTILKAVVGLAALLAGISAIASIVSTVSIGIAGFTAVMSALNAVLFANPIGLIVLAILALGAAVSIIIKKWDDWGAAIAVVAGYFFPFIMLAISLIQSFRRNWDGIVKAFQNDGIVAGIKMIGATILDAILMPLQQVLSLIGKVTGANWAISAAEGLEGFRKSLGVNVETDPEGSNNPNAPQKPQDPDLLMREITKNQNQNVNVNIKDSTGRATVESDSNDVPVKLTSTLGW